MMKRLSRIPIFCLVEIYICIQSGLDGARHHGFRCLREFRTLFDPRRTIVYAAQRNRKFASGGAERFRQIFHDEYVGDFPSRVAEGSFSSSCRIFPFRFLFSSVSLSLSFSRSRPLRSLFAPPLPSSVSTLSPPISFHSSSSLPNSSRLGLTVGRVLVVLYWNADRYRSPI